MIISTMGLFRSTALPRLIGLFALLYSAFGVSSPFLPAFLEARGLTPEQIGLALAAGTAVRLVSGPTAGRVADLLHAARSVLTACAMLGALSALGFLPGHTFWVLMAVSVSHAAMLAPLTILADALALAAATHPRHTNRFEYGWVRGTGSAAFVVGTVATGWVVSAFGLTAIIWLHVALLMLAGLSAKLVPEVNGRLSVMGHDSGRREHASALLRLPLFRRLVLCAALVLGSHALNDSFALIRWSAAGINPLTSSLLWSLSVMAEVAVFLIIGPPLIRRFGPALCMAIAATAGIVRWAVMALTVDVVDLAIVQPLHGLTFALLHLSCIRLLADIVPPGLAATAQAIYGTVGIGVATALVTLASGWLYGRFGANAFWAMAAMCALALPLTFRMRI